MRERRTNPTRRQRFEFACKELRDRLRRVLQNTPAHELDWLAAKMTRLKFKYEPWTGMPVRGDTGSDRVGA